MSDNQQDDQDKNRPFTIRDGKIKASIFRNEAESGVFHTTRVVNSYIDKDGNWQETNNFTKDELLPLAEVARKAYDKSRNMDREEREAIFKEKRDQTQNQSRTKSRDY